MYKCYQILLDQINLQHGGPDVLGRPGLDEDADLPGERVEEHLLGVVGRLGLGSLEEGLSPLPLHTHAGRGATVEERRRAAEGGAVALARLGADRAAEHRRPLDGAGLEGPVPGGLHHRAHPADAVLVERGDERAGHARASEATWAFFWLRSYPAMLPRRILHTAAVGLAEL